MFNRKGRPIHPSRGFSPAYAQQVLTASEQILHRTLKDGAA